MAMRAGVFVVEELDQLVSLLARVDADQGVDFRFEPIVVLLRARRAEVEEIGQPDDLP